MAADQFLEQLYVFVIDVHGAGPLTVNKDGVLLFAPNTCFRSLAGLGWSYHNHSPDKGNYCNCLLNMEL